jgi:hypothetical protein
MPGFEGAVQWGAGAYGRKAAATETQTGGQCRRGCCAASSRRQGNVEMEGFVLYAPGCRAPWQRATPQPSKAPRITGGFLSEASKLSGLGDGKLGQLLVGGRRVVQ